MASPEEPRSRSQATPFVVDGFGDAVAHLRDGLANTSGNADKKIQLDSCLQAIWEHGTDNGLDHEELLDVAELITRSDLGLTPRRKLIKALVPRTTVPVQIAINVVSRFNVGGSGRDNFVTSRPLQALMLKWVVMVIDLIDDREKLHAIYGVLFLYLDYETLRAELCHLLYILTEKNDVVPFRIRRLLTLQRNVGQEPEIHALLTCYKRFCPHLVSLVPTRSSRKSWFPRVDPLWHASVHSFQRTGTSAESGPAAPITLSQRKRGKRARMLPTAPIPRTALLADKDSIALHSVRSFDSLTKIVEKVALPSQVAAVLDTDSSTLLRYVVLYSADPSALHRLDNWLAATLSQLCYTYPWSEPEKDAGCQLLDQTADLCNFIGSTLPGVDRFLAEFLLRWNGVDCQQTVLTLIALIPPRPFEVLYQDVLHPLYSIFASGSASVRRSILRCLTTILARYAEFDWVGHYSKREGRPRVDGEKSWEDIYPISEADYMRTMYDLVDFIDGVCCVATLVEKNDLAVFDALLTFYEYASRLNAKYGLPLTIIPSHGVVYGCLLAPTLDIVSRFCGILQSMTDEVENEDKRVLNPLLSTNYFGLENHDYFKFYLPDFPAMLWNGSMLQEARDVTAGSILFDAPMYIRRNVQSSPSDTSSDIKPQSLANLRSTFRDMVLKATAATNGFRVNSTMQPRKQIGSSLDITVLFSGFAVRYLQAMKKKAGSKAGHVTIKPSFINREAKYRRHFLQWLKAEHAADGLADFLSAQ